MWISASSLDWLKVSEEAFINLREEVASLKVERDTLKTQLTATQANFDWLRMRVNSLELERAQLLSKAYDVQIPVPSVVRRPDPLAEAMNQFSFNDMGEDLAKKLGLPSYEV